MSLMLIILLLLTFFLVRFLWPLFRVGFGIYRQVKGFQKNQPKAPEAAARPQTRAPKGDYIEFEEVRSMWSVHEKAQRL